MSKQGHFAMLGRVMRPDLAARHHLKRDVLPVLSARAETLPSLGSVAYLQGYGIHRVTKAAPISEAQLLAALLLWIEARGDVPVPTEVAIQAGELAARILDYPEIIAEAKRRSQSSARKGKGRGYDPLVPNVRSDAIAAALRRRGSEDRDIVVNDLAATLGIQPSQARRILAEHGWPGREKRVR
jgi:hypothetical protein